MTLEKKTEIIQTVGVSHNSTPTIIKQEYEKDAKEFQWLQGKDKIAMIVLSFAGSISPSLGSNLNHSFQAFL